MRYTGKKNTAAGLRVVGMTTAIITEGDDTIKGKTIQIEVFAGHFAAGRPFYRGP